MPGRGDANWYGFANYLIRKHDNEKVVSNLRAEFFTDSQSFRTGTAGTYFDLTHGITWTATKRLLVKPFVRYDYNRHGAFGGNDRLYTGGLVLIAKW